MEDNKPPASSNDQMTDLINLVKQQTTSIDQLGQQVKDQKKEIDILKEKNTDLVKQKSTPKDDTRYLKQSFLNRPFQKPAETLVEDEIEP